MSYKFTCPRCGDRMSRWRMFSTLSLDYRCGRCGATFRLNVWGWLVCLGVVALQFLCFALTLKQLISAPAAIGLLLLICVLTFWLLPYLTPVRTSGQPESERK